MTINIAAVEDCPNGRRFSVTTTRVRAAIQSNEPGPRIRWCRRGILCRSSDVVYQESPPSDGARSKSDSSARDNIGRLLLRLPSCRGPHCTYNIDGTFLFCKNCTHATLRLGITLILFYILYHLRAAGGSFYQLSSARPAPAAHFQFFSLRCRATPTRLTP